MANLLQNLLKEAKTAVKKPAAKATAKPAVKKPVAKATAKPAVKATAKAAAKPVAKPAAKPVAKATAKATAKPAVKATAKPAVKTTAKPAAKPAVKAVAKPVAKPAVKATAKPVAKAAPKPVAKAAAKPVAKPAAKAAAKPVAKPAVKAAAKPAAKPAVKKTATKTTVKPAVKKPVAKPAVKSVAKPVAKPAVKATAKPALKSAAKPALKSAVKAAAKPAVKAAAKPAVKATAKPVAKATAKPAVKVVAKPVAKATAKPAVKAVAKPAVKAAAKPAVKAVATPTAKSNLRAVATTGSAAPKVVAASATKSTAKSEQSLDGVWVAEGTDGKVKVTFSGNTGVISAIFPYDDTLPKTINNDAVKQGYIKVGSKLYRNIKSTSDLHWSGELLGIRFKKSEPDVATGTGYKACTFKLSEDGQTLTVRGTNKIEWKRSGEKPANSIPFVQMNGQDLVTVLSVTAIKLKQIQVEYKVVAKETIKKMTIFIKCFYWAYDPKEFDNVEHNAKSGETYKPTVFAISKLVDIAQTVRSVEITIVKGTGKKAIDLEKAEDYLDKICFLFENVDNDTVQKLLKHLETIKGVLEKVNKGMDIYSSFKNMYDVFLLGDDYKKAETSEEKRKLAKTGNLKMLETVERFSSFVSGPLYGMIIPVVCQMVASVYNNIEYSAQKTDLTWWYQYEPFYDEYYGNEERFENLVLEMKSNGAEVEQVTEALKEIRELEEMNK
jgi:hypothetical protein